MADPIRNISFINYDDTITTYPTALDSNGLIPTAFVQNLDLSIAPFTNFMWSGDDIVIPLEALETGAVITLMNVDPEMEAHDFNTEFIQRETLQESLTRLFNLHTQLKAYVDTYSLNVKEGDFNATDEADNRKGYIVSINETSGEVEFTISKTDFDSTIALAIKNAGDIATLTSIVSAIDGKVNSHIANMANPHSVTKAQVGLGRVDDTADQFKKVSDPQQAALDGKVDNAQVLTDVPAGAVFTDTVYDDTAIQAEVDLNTAKVSNVAHPLVETAVPLGAVFTDTVYDDTALQAEVDGKVDKAITPATPAGSSAITVDLTQQEALTVLFTGDSIISLSGGTNKLLGNLFIIDNTPSSNVTWGAGIVVADDDAVPSGVSRWLLEYTLVTSTTWGYRVTLIDEV